MNCLYLPSSLFNISLPNVQWLEFSLCFSNFFFSFYKLLVQIYANCSPNFAKLNYKSPSSYASNKVMLQCDMLSLDMKDQCFAIVTVDLL